MNKKVIIGIISVIVIIGLIIGGVLLLRNDYGMNGNDYKNQNDNTNQVTQK